MFKNLNEATKYRILIALLLLGGWFVVIFLRSGTAW